MDPLTIKVLSFVAVVIVTLILVQRHFKKRRIQKYERNHPTCRVCNEGVIPLKDTPHRTGTCIICDAQALVGEVVVDNTDSVLEKLGRQHTSCGAKVEYYRNRTNPVYFIWKEGTD